MLLTQYTTQYKNEKHESNAYLFKELAGDGVNEGGKSEHEHTKR